MQAKRDEQTYAILGAVIEFQTKEHRTLNVRLMMEKVKRFSFGRLVNNYQSRKSESADNNELEELAD